MNSSSGSLQDSANIFFLLIIYIPFNIFFMVVAAVVFSAVNKLLHLHFPIWILAIAAALLVFVMMATFLTDRTGNSTMYYVTTLLINTIVVVLLLTLTGITNLIFSNHASADFSFGRPQLIATLVYALITGTFAIQPLISDGKGYLNDIRSERKLLTLKKVIDANDIEAFTEISDQTVELWKTALPSEKIPLLSYLITHDNVAMVHVLTQGHKDLFTYSLAWDIKSLAMLEMLIADGMDPNQVIKELAVYNQTELIKFTVENYHPTFTNSVSFITENVLRNNNDVLLTYLINHGLCKDITQSNETLYWLGEKQDTTSIYRLIEKGFSVDTSDNRLIYRAIYNNNLPFLKFLFTYPFDVNGSSDEYTNLENAITSNRDDIFDFLLTKNPDVTTLHYTKLNGNTNALLMAERYEKMEMLDKLKRYVTHQE